MSAVDSYLVDDGGDIYYDDDFRNVLEAHMTYLRSASSTTVMNVDPHDAYVYEFDLNGLLLKMGIPLKLHWVVMRMNNYRSPQNVPADLSTLLIAAPNEIEVLRQSFQTAAKIR